MSRSDAAEPIIAPADGFETAACARRALAHERVGRFRDAWAEWEALRVAHPSRPDWNAPLAASYLRFAFDWTSDGPEGSLREAEEALLRGVAILTNDLASHPDDISRLMLVARACEQRCMLRAFGDGWTRAARMAIESGEAPALVGDPRQVRAAGCAATVALDLVAIHAPSLAPLAAELARICLRLAATLEAAGAFSESTALLLRAETVLKGPGRAAVAAAGPTLVAIEGTNAPEALTPPRRPRLTLVTNPTA